VGLDELGSRGKKNTTRGAAEAEAEADGGVLQLYGARYRAVRPQGHTLSQSPSRSRSPRGEKCRQHHPLASRAGPTLHWTSKLKQRQKKNDQRTNPTIPTGDRSRKATRGTWETRHRAGGHGGARDTRKRRAARSRARSTRRECDGRPLSTPAAAVSKSGDGSWCLLAFRDETAAGGLGKRGRRGHHARLSYPQTPTRLAVPVRVSASRFGCFWRRQT
jgi:hypothetical protein